MDKVLRVFVEKKMSFGVEAAGLLSDIRENLRISNLKTVRIFNRYDVEGVDADTFDRALPVIFSEPQVDDIFFELPKEVFSGFVFAIEYLPGQYDQRADSCAQCIQLLTGGFKPRVSTATVYALSGDLSDEDFSRIKSYIINPVECREASFDKPVTLEAVYDIPTSVDILSGFTGLSDRSLFGIIDELGLAMDKDDIVFCRDYFKNDEGRDPTITEIRMIDTYWSDHCRHTTFLTEIENVEIEDGYIKEVYDSYVGLRARLHRTDKPVCLMDIATIGMKALKNAGRLSSLDQSEEINACSVNVTITVDNEEQQWLLMFKNETHNHPTEIEPFGGAATCLGGAIRDPLSGRSYVYQAMRVTGAADPTASIETTLPGKLPQRKICRTAAAGYSSYGNQIGLATGQVSEIYHPGYVAKRLEIGAVIGAAPKSHVIRKVPSPGDMVILLGGRTGRDGCGGATGSSKSHTDQSLSSCGAEVQKGNAPEERKLQRLFRNPDATRLIKRCNDFGAGGVSVAIGELADGLEIDLNAVPRKYDGLDGTELAISESQERMAVVVEEKSVSAFIALARAENLEATVVARVSEKPRLKMNWNGRTIVDISRKFLNSNGAPKTTDARIQRVPLDAFDAPVPTKGESLKERFINLMSDLNVCSQKGLAERFDSTIGAGTVNMPFGGKRQLTPSQYMAALFPVLGGRSDDASLMAYGLNPYVGSISPFHGAVYAITDSVAKIMAAGGSLDNCWLTLQEYFERTKTDPIRWGKPTAALLGAIYAQMSLGIAAIGGKDSMSGTFMDIDVPPTLCSFAVSVAKAGDIVTNHFKKPGSYVFLLKAPYDENRLPRFDLLKEGYTRLENLIKDGKVLSSWALGFGAVAEGVAKMCMGNGFGLEFDEGFDQSSLFELSYGSILIESDGPIEGLTAVGKVVAKPIITIGADSIELELLEKSFSKTLEKVYPTRVEGKVETVKEIRFTERARYGALSKIATPKVFIPVFPGTNCEYDTARKFEQAGAFADVFVFKNITPTLLEESVAEMARRIDCSNILMLPGGFSGGDEPDGSGKFIAALLRSPRIKEAVTRLIEQRDGLILGICNGFQALIKVGLVPYGRIMDMDDQCPTLTFNTIGRHQSLYVNTRVSSVKSPWLMGTQVGDIHAVPISHGEGRFIAPPHLIQSLIEGGQIATQYVDLNGRPTMELPYNPNGSMMAVEGICSPDGRILGKMGHSERSGPNIALNICGQKDQKIFESGVNYFKL